MTEAGATGSGAAGRGNTLGLRLALAFLSVALAAVALLAVLTAVFSSVDVSSLGGRQRDVLAGAFAAVAGSAWQQNQGWTGADLDSLRDLSAKTGVRFQVLDAGGRPVEKATAFAAAAGPTATAPVLVHGRREGTVLVRLTASGLGGADAILRTALLRAIAGTAGLAALLALFTGLGLARRITQPVARLISVTRAMAGGDRSARVGGIRAPGELRELAAAFDQMADSLDYEDKIRRDLVASVAHELRTPVAVLQAGHEALLDGVTEPTPEELGSLRDEVLRLARMVDDLQTMAAADAAVLQLTREPRDLAAIAGAAADSLARRFEAAEVTLDRRLDPAPALADERWMHQVVTNLLGNALKFTPAGGTVTISTGTKSAGPVPASLASPESVSPGSASPVPTSPVSAGPVPVSPGPASPGSAGPVPVSPGPTGPSAVLEVADTGIGIPADELPRIFDRFWRGQAAATQTSGSGIGLAIAAELTWAHGGTLTAVSEPGAGTRLTLTLPAA